MWYEGRWENVVRNELTLPEECELLIPGRPSFMKMPILLSSSPCRMSSVVVVLFSGTSSSLMGDGRELPGLSSSARTTQAPITQSFFCHIILSHDTVT